MPSNKTFAHWPGGIMLVAMLLVSGLVTLQEAYSADLELLSLSTRARVSEKTVLGKDAPEEFEEYDISLRYRLRWQFHETEHWVTGTRLMTSAGMLISNHKTSIAVSAIPLLTLESRDGHYVFDAGIGAALFSRHRFGRQDFGGPFQFAITVGVEVPLYKQVGIGYRFMHYSDAALNGPDTIGVDFHMLEFSYRL